MITKYILNAQGEPVAELNLLKWAEWFEHSDQQRIVCQETISGIEVSTVFLALNHNFGNPMTPILWETKTFGAVKEITKRCSGNREQAEAMHFEVVQEVQKSIHANE